MENKYKVTGRFSLLNGNSGIIKDEFFVNIKVKADDFGKALTKAVKTMSITLAKKYHQPVQLKQTSDVVVRKIWPDEK